jgi:iron complex transport system substrate-binding protein
MKSAACKIIFVALCASLAFMSASASDFTLHVFGNANMDDTIDEQDIEYVQGIIDGSKDETELADANYDGTIDEDDIAQIELIIDGDETELTIIDDMGDAVTVQEPINSVIYVGHNSYVYETWRALDLEDKLVATTDRFIKPGGSRYSVNYYPELLEMQSVGTLQEPDFETIVDIMPDILYTDEEQYDIKSTAANKIPGIPVICMDVNPENFAENTRITGYLFDRREEADKYIDWRNGLKSMIEDRTSELSEDEKPSVLLMWFVTPGMNEFSIYSGRNSNEDDLIVGAGGTNTVGDLTESVKVDSEWIVDRNPDIIIMEVSILYSGYDFDDPSELAALYDDFMSRPEFAEISAVKNSHVYLMNYAHLMVGGGSAILAEAYMAKWFQPEIFTDLDPQEIQQEFLEFQGIDFDLSKHGQFVYPQ